MSAVTHADRYIIDHLYRWPCAGRDGVCPERRQKRLRTDQERPSGIARADEIDLGEAVAPTGPPEPCRLERRSENAAPGTATKSP
jgi:hypothetical protein